MSTVLAQSAMNNLRWAIVFCGLLVLASCEQADLFEPKNNGLQTFLGDALPGYAVVVPGRPFHFPQDHGPHSDYRTEWWYYTGHLNTAEGAHFGFQFTLFRVNLQPKKPLNPSYWAMQHLLMGHLSITDVHQQRYYHAQRLEREALGFAGAQTQPFRVWLQDWQISGDPLSPTLVAKTDDMMLNLQLHARKPIVLQGEQGYSQKGAAPENASYYYSITRMGVTGEIGVAGKIQTVTGQAWFDREWSSHALDAEQVGWDWFSLQLSDNRELMYYQLRNQQGHAAAQSRGVLIGPKGQVEMTLKPEDIVLTPESYWQSPDGQRYPVDWQLEVRKANIKLYIKAMVDDQAFTGMVRYWEGAVSLSGQVGDDKITGVGYVELTGY